MLPLISFAAATSLAGSLNSTIPNTSQIIDPASFAVLPTVLPSFLKNGSTPFIPPNTTVETLKARPFHIYSEEFLDIIGDSPSIRLIATMDSNPFAHEGPIWYPPTNQVFFTQNAVAAKADPGFVYAVSLDDVDQALAANQQVNVSQVDISPALQFPNGGTNYRDQLLFVTQGSGSEYPATLTVVNPRAPYNATVILNNFFGRQFNSLNDVAINPRTFDIAFTDVTYGNLQGFRPTPELPPQVYSFNPCTGLVRVLADGFVKLNGLTFSPSGKTAYVTDTAASSGDETLPSTIYAFDVAEDGTFSSRRTFAFADNGLPDGIHCDENGNVYVGQGDGIAVFSSAGKLLGKIFVGAPGSANFIFAGQGQIVLLSERRLYLVQIAAQGHRITDYDYPSCT